MAKRTTKAAGEKAAEGDTMRLRFRREATIDGTTYRQGQVESVPISDEAWDAVNVGAADLDPPPGVAGQPFPPEELQRSEATEAPLPEPTVVTAVPASTARLRGGPGQPRETPPAAKTRDTRRAAAKGAAKRGARSAGAKTGDVTPGEVGKNPHD